MIAARTIVLALLAATLGFGAARAQTAPAAAATLTAADLAQPKRPAMSEGVAAVVNDDIVSTYDLRQRVLLMLVTYGVQATEPNLRALEREALKNLVDERLEMQEIKSIEAKNKDVHLEPTPDELSEQIDTMARQYSVKRAQFISTLKSAGVEEKTLNDQIFITLAWHNYIGGRFRGAVHVGDAMVNQEEARLNAAAAKPQYQVSEILIDTAKAGGVEQAQEGAKQLIAQIKQGAPFAAVARQFSALPTAANGGDAGWLSSGELQPPLEHALSEMRPGQISDPVPMADGVYILQLRDKHAGVGATLVTLKQAAIPVSNEATPEQIQAAGAKLATLKSEVKSCEDLEGDAAKFDGVVAGDLGETEVNDLAPEFKQVVEGLKIGQVGGPVRTRAGLHLVALCGRRASGPHAPSRDEITDRLEGEQLSMIARRYLRDLHNSATIESR
jgi:peptidyl-prolyl cis-trans isomerase SurA